MLSKEEIKYIKDLEEALENNESFYQKEDMYELLEIVKRQQSDKQKLIEKLEEIMKETVQNIKPETMKKYQNIKMEEIDDETYILLAMHRIGFAGEILEIVKGEKN